MNLWLAISLVLGVTTIYLFTIEFFEVAMKLTGLATSKIHFQVSSLFTGAGYTTAESELVVNDEKRRKIALACMYTGHIFSVAFMGLIINVLFSISLAVTEIGEQPRFTEWYFIVLYVTLFLFALVLLIKVPPINKRFQKMLETIAINSSKKNRSTNIITVFDLYGKHAIAEVVLNIVPDFMKDVPLYEMGLTKKYSINVLSIKRGSRIIEVTKGTMFARGDHMVVFGLINDIKEAFVNSISKAKDAVAIDRSNEITLVSNYGPNALVEVYVDEVPPELKDVKLMDAHMKDRYGITIGLIKRKDQYVAPDKDTIIQRGDNLTLFGPYKSIKVLFRNESDQQ